jgi:hypothetical protein
MSESYSLPTEPEGMAAPLLERFNSSEVSAMMTLYEPEAESRDGGATARLTRVRHGDPSAIDPLFSVACTVGQTVCDVVDAPLGHLDLRGKTPRFRPADSRSAPLILVDRRCRVGED